MKNIMIILTALTLTSCATLFSRSSDKVTFKTNPEGAEVYQDGEKLGVTPLTVVMDRNTFNSSYITLRKKGYETKRFMLKKSIATAAIFNLSSVLSWATDAVSGNLLEYSPRSYFYDLKKGGSALNDDSAVKFMVVNYNKIIKDIARGDGDFLKTYAKLLKVKNYEAFKTSLHVSFGSISKEKDSIRLHNRIVKDFI